MRSHSPAQAMGKQNTGELQMFVLGRRTAGAVIAGAVMMAGLSVAGAADEPANIIKYRQNVMKANGGHISAIAAIAKGDVSFMDQAEDHARAMAATAGDILPLFPEGSDTGADHRSLPAIWTDWAGFEKAAKAYEDAMPALVEAAASGDRAALGGALRDVGQACKGCHDDFREDK